MEHKIGEIFEFGGEWYQCVNQNGCCNCAFYNTSCHLIDELSCNSLNKKRKEKYIFKKLEKVGEPREYFIQGMGIIMIQEYILANANYIWEYGQDVVVMDCQNGKVAIEIKQNKEDMEEKKQKLDDLVGLYTSAKITYKEFDEKLKTLYADKEECKSSLKEFDINLAKAGKPICTRDRSFTAIP